MRLKTEHTTKEVSAADLLGTFDEALDAADQPSIDGINTYYICKLARQAGLTVALCGHGGDELFGGYDNFRLIPRVMGLKAIPRRLRDLLGQASRACGPARVSTGKAASLLMRPRLDVHEVYSLARSVFWEEPRARLLEEPEGMLPASEFVRATVPPAEAAGDVFNRVSQLELGFYLRNSLLRDADVCSMAHGLELRVPLLDHRLVEFVASLPGRVKVGRGNLKGLLVDAMGGDLPPEVSGRRKQGFVIPYELWIRGALKPRLDEVLTEASLSRALGLRPESVARIWSAFLGGYRGINMQHPLALYVLLRWCHRNRVTT
jgi:asparagine synthase (glutamine-hydrolysing)